MSKTTTVKAVAQSVLLPAMWASLVNDARDVRHMVEKLTEKAKEHTKDMDHYRRANDRVYLEQEAAIEKLTVLLNDYERQIGEAVQKYGMYQP